MMVNRSLVNRSAPELFPASVLVKKRYIRRETRERRAFERPSMKARKALKTIETFILNKLPIKLNLMPEFFHLLGRAKVR